VDLKRLFVSGTYTVCPAGQERVNIHFDSYDRWQVLQKLLAMLFLKIC